MRRSSRGCPSPGPGLTEDYDRARPVRCRRLRARRVRAGGYFICGFLAGKPGMDHELLYDDGSHVAHIPGLDSYLSEVDRFALDMR